METSMTEKQTISTSPMKQSVSMTSLMPPPTSTERDRDVSDSSIAAKVRIERPYNSLKKERNSEKDLWRNSWGSNQSFVGKDDFWLALQSNYNYIMDTNLIDSCREARGELERNYSTETSQTDQKKINGGKQSDDYIVDLKRLRLWLREMEKQLAQFPTISDAIKMKDFELERLQKKNEELYRIIGKHAKLIGACTRSLSRQREHCSETPTSFILQNNTDNFKSELEQKQQQQQLPHDDDNCFSSLETHITRRSHSSNNSNNECNLKALERRYHSLYLKSFEISVLLENLLKNDDLQNSASQSSSSEVDEGPAAKLARFTNDLIAENHQRRSINPNQSKRKFYELTDEQASDDDDDCRFPSYFDDTVINVQTNGFDADSEGSDSELMPKMNNNIEEQATNTSTDNNGNPLNVSNNTEEMTQNTETDLYGSKSASLPPMPSKQMAGVKRQRKVDATKFNRSNRESKNCGTFYFKHSDTEPETGSHKNNGNDWSSQATSELCSEEEWEYSKGSDVNGNHSNDNEDTIDNENLANLSIQVNVNDTIIDTVDSPFAKREQYENEKFDQQMQSTPVSVVVKSSIEKRLYKEIPKAYSKESIQQLVMGAENLVRDELLKTPVRSRRQSADAQVSARKTVHSLNSSKYKRVEHWLQNQSQPKQTLTVPTLNTDGEASCEYTTESDARDSDGSEELADSVATTCLQATGNKSQCTSTEVITTSVDLLKDSPESCQTNKVVPRTNRRNSERPVSVSCISQLTKQTPTNCLSDDANNQGLANHSISESALHTLNIGSQSSLRMKSSDSKNSLKKRRMRLKKKQRSESGSNASEASGGNRRGSYSSLMKSESFSGHLVIKETQTVTVESVAIETENEDEITLPKPNFQVGACTTNMFNSTHLGNLAPLAFYNLKGNTNTRELSFTGTEDNSNVSEQIDQVWDDYQEKYLSEAYSEGRDSDAARKLLEFGDDYRNFIDSQSDCCSSLSAANNLDSMSPPRGRKPIGSGQIPNKPISKSPSDEDNAMRKRRAFEIEWRRRTHGENHRKPFTEERRKLSNGTDTMQSRTSHKSQKTPKANISRKLEMEFSKAFFGNERRRMKSNESKEILSSSSSAASSDAEDETHIDIVLNQSRRDLENTQALKIRRHLLHSEDYTEIIATCSENMRCLKTVLHSPGGSLLSNRRHELIRELLSSWESLLHWSENESFVKQSQEEMATLVDKLNKIGTSQSTLDTESAIQFAIQEAKDEKAQLHTYRSSMLRLNASVHSWLTRHEKRKQIEMAANKTAVTTTSIDSGNADENGNSAEDSTLESSTITIKEVSSSNAVGTSIDADDCTFNEELHKQLKNEVGNMYKVWDEADERVKNRLESVTTSLIAWKQFENGINEFKEVLGKDTGALKRLTGALEMGTDVISNNLAYDVKEVAKRLSEKMDNQNNIATATSQQNTTSQPKLSHIGAMAFNLPSNGSLSDSGISDGGCSSDYGLSERERRLGALRRLAKQLEQALVPGSEALNSINQRMEMAEAELRSLQETCRELIIRTAVSQPNRLATASQTTGSTSHLDAIVSNASAANIINQQPINFQIPIINVKAKTTKRTTPNKRKQRRRTNSSGTNGISLMATPKMPLAVSNQYDMMTTASEPDPDDPKDDTIVEDADEKGTWSWRVAKYAVPVQLALIALFCAACFMEPHCCDGANNFAWSLSPHLRYVRGPPPI
ncbi:uncharacterized protein LOC116342976 [Contarinia nasturtii]|uniref:uncharacterized protein LOC116342976 n=1 Tax=Contarinia nasturtii TaxID=265458 RepID=UPI0012D48221|nr:uncharacterized protein LOC116342976 [Contarinia nasturtii]XP_031626682.1 uncharacterized protein LOC116342976 [Contarinia nasturtii]